MPKDLKYSGKTTWQETREKRGESLPEDFAGGECISTVALLNVTWSNCPVEVREDVRSLWDVNEKGNGSFLRVVTEDLIEEGDKYEYLIDFLGSRGIKECIIDYWW